MTNSHSKAFKKVLSRLKKSERNGKRNNHVDIGKEHEDNDERIEIGVWEEFAPEISNVKFLVPGWIPYESITLLVGISGAGKSYFTIGSLVKAVITGCPTFTGSRVHQTSKVLWCDTEGRLGNNIGRLKDMNKGSSQGVISPFKDPLKALQIDRDDHMDLLEKIIVQEKTSLVVIDTFTAAHSLPENDPIVAKPLYALQSIAKRTGAAILLLHHPRKNYIYQDELTQDSVRGSSAIVGAFTSIIGMEKFSEDAEWVKIKSLKYFYGRPPSPLGMKNHGDRLEFGDPPVKRFAKMNNTNPTEKQTCADWLIENMEKDKRYPVADLVVQAETAGFSRSTLNRAVKDLGIKSCRRLPSSPNSDRVWIRE